MAAEQGAMGADEAADTCDASGHRPALRFCFLLVPGFSLLALSCAIDVLRAARLEASQAGFDWVLASADGTQVARSSAGIELDTAPLPEPGGIDAIAVCGGDRTHDFASATCEAFLRRAAAVGVAVGSISDGAFVPARAGLFAAARSTIHWKCQAAYREAFPDLDIRASLWEIDGARFSCAGGTASLDLMLQFVRSAIGPAVAGRIADNYVHDRFRGDDEIQPALGGVRLARLDARLAAAVTMMERSVAEPVPLDAIAAVLDLSPRRLNRLFHRHVGCAPSEHYLRIRLGHAARLLRQSPLPIAQVALACGFQSSSHLSRHLVRRYGAAPSALRRAAAGIDMHTG